MNFQEKWRKLLLPLRYGGSGVDFKKLDPARSPFLQDRDRIIYSSSFRRLARKTQVHPLVRNDHIHTRLSHSLEVSSVGRSLGAMAGYFLRRRDELPEYAAPEPSRTLPAGQSSTMKNAAPALTARKSARSERLSGTAGAARSTSCSTR